MPFVNQQTALPNSSLGEREKTRPISPDSSNPEWWKGSASAPAIENQQGPHRPFGEDHEPEADIPLIRVCDLEIDTIMRKVKRGGKEIRLTPHEYALLEFLAQRRGRIVRREEIRQHLYKHNEHRSNVIDAHICYLRHKIDKDFTLPLILTRWGEGYMLRNEIGPMGEGAAADVYW